MTKSKNWCTSRRCDNTAENLTKNELYFSPMEFKNDTGLSMQIISAW